MDGDGNLVFAGFGHLEVRIGIRLINTEFTICCGDIIADCFITREFPAAVFYGYITIVR